MREQYAKGHDLKTVEKVLLKSGYNKEQIEHAIAEIIADGNESKKKESKETKPKAKAAAKKEAKPKEEKKPAAKPKAAPKEHPKEHKKVVHKPHTSHKHPAKTGFFKRLGMVLFNLDHFVEEIKEGEGFAKAFGLYCGAFFLITPLILAVAYLYYGAFTTAAGSADLPMTLLTFLIGSIGLFVMATVFYLVALLIMHGVVYMLGSRNGISKTYQAFFYAMVPMVLFLWLIPLFPVFMIFVVYSLFAFYELLKHLHKFDRRQAVMSMVLTKLVAFVVLIVLVLTISPLLESVTIQVQSLGNLLL